MNAFRDDRAKQTFERVPPSEDTMFGEDLDAGIKHMSQLNLLKLSYMPLSYSYAPNHMQASQETSTCYSLQKGSKVNHPRIARIIFPTIKGTGSKRKDSNRYRTLFSSRKSTKLFRTMTRIINNPSALNSIQGHKIQFHTQPSIQTAPD